MRWLLLIIFTLTACGTRFTLGDPLTPEQEAVKLSIQPKLEAYFNADLTSVWLNTTVTTKPKVVVSTDCNIPNIDGCYLQSTDIIVDEEVDFCQILAHEYTHAIGDQIFGDPDSAHVIFNFKEIEHTVCLH